MRVPLTGGAYQSRSLIASAQRCLNLYEEPLPRQEGEPTPATHNLTPGLTLLVALPLVAQVRGVYTASNGDLYVVVGSELFYVSSAFACTYIATLTTSSGPVSMIDNTLTLVVVDGSARGTGTTNYAGGVQVDLPTRVPSLMPDENNGFYGADKVDFLSTFLIFNKPNTPQYYVSDSLAVTFTSLYFANKTSSPDYLQTLMVARGEIWLIGNQYSSEIWTLSGASDFPFQIVPGVVVEQGCIAKYSVAKSDGQIFWLAQNREGVGIVLKASGYEAKRISSFGIEALIAGFYVYDAIGYCYQFEGHTFYVLTFPTSNATLVFDQATEAWHEWSTAGGRHLSNCHAFAYGKNIVGDFANGYLYELDGTNKADNGQPIQRLRSFPHFMNDGKRVIHRQFIADMETGNLDPGRLPGVVQLRWSDDRGATFGNPLYLTMDNTQDSLSFRRLGMARDRVYEISWSSAVDTSLNGCFLDLATAET